MEIWGTSLAVINDFQCRYECLYMMIQRFVTSAEKSVFNGQTQISYLSGIDEERVPFTVSVSQASKQIRMEKFDYFLWDGKDKFIQLMSVANYVEVMEQDPELNLETI